AATRISGGVADVQSFLNGRKRNLSRVFDLLGIVCHVSPSPLLLNACPRRALRKRPLASSKSTSKPYAAAPRDPPGRACPQIRQTSYWLPGAKDMAALNTILIIVNSTSP